MLMKCTECGIFNLCQYVFVIASPDNFPKGDAWRQPEDLPAAEHLPRKLVEEGESLFVGSGFAEPGDGMMEDPG